MSNSGDSADKILEKVGAFRVESVMESVKRQCRPPNVISRIDFVFLSSMSSFTTKMWLP